MVGVQSRDKSQSSIPCLHALIAVLACSQLRGKTDARFVEIAFRVLRDVFRINPRMTVSQFLSEVHS